MGGALHKAAGDDPLPRPPKIGDGIMAVDGF